MANRHLARSIILQTLFERDFNEKSQNRPGVLASLKRNIDEFAPGFEDPSFSENLLKGILSKQKTLDEIIEKAAPEWPLDKISAIDRNVLRLGLYELLFGDRKEVPPKVAINEAIELAKGFGGENSSKFVNGVLGTIYKEIGEPGKEQTSKRKKVEAADMSKLPVKKLGGALIYGEEGENIYLALVHDFFGYWTLSKGHIKEGETEEDGTRRAIKEEIGLDIEIVEKLGENEYVASHPEEGKMLKKVSYFLARAPRQELKLRESGGLDEARWFKLDEIEGLKIYDDILGLIARSVPKIMPGNYL